MAGSVTREVCLPVTPAELWPALTEAGQLAEWFAADVEIDPREGGVLSFRWEDTTRRAVIEEIDQPRRLSFRWAAPAGDGGEIDTSVVEFSLEPVEEGTRLKVVETVESTAGLPAVAACLGAGTGWQVMLRRLALRRCVPVA